MLNVKLLNNSGIGVHHMWDHYFADNNAFERNLTRLEPTLRKLAQITNVVWWNQFALVDSFISVNGDFRYYTMYSEKVDLYNSMAKTILK